MPTAAANLHHALAREAGESRIEHRAEDFAHAVGAEVEAQHAVAVAHAAIVADHRRDDELVELLLGIGVGDRRPADRESAAPPPRPSRRRPWRRAPSACRGPSRSSGRRRWRSAPTAAARPTSRLRSSPADCGGVSRPSVKACTTRRHAGVGEDLRQRHGVVLMRMHAARRDQAHQVAGAAALPSALRSGRCSAGARSISPRRDGVADARQVLHHHAAGADVEVADLGIAHLAVAAGRRRGRRCAGTRAGPWPTAGRSRACWPAGRRCRRRPRASPSRPARPASPGGASA